MTIGVVAPRDHGAVSQQGQAVIYPAGDCHHVSQARWHVGLASVVVGEVGTGPILRVGVLASLTAPLAETGIGVFALSTYDTDYLLVKENDFRAAVDALRRHGHTVQ